MICSVKSCSQLPTVNFSNKQVCARPGGCYDMRPSRIITDKYHNNETFPLVQYIQRHYV